MVFTNEGRRQAALRLGDNTGSLGYFAIGSGSGTALVTNTTLVTEVAKFIQTGSQDASVVQKSTFTGDRSALQMSGIALREFGIYASGPALVGSIWAREGFAAITFDGSSELRIVY